MYYIKYRIHHLENQLVYNKQEFVSSFKIAKCIDLTSEKIKIQEIILSLGFGMRTLCLVCFFFNFLNKTLQKPPSDNYWQIVCFDEAPTAMIFH